MTLFIAWSVSYKIAKLRMIIARWHFFWGAASCSYNLLADPISKHLLDTQNVLHVLDCGIAAKPVRLLLQAEFRLVDGTVNAEREGYNCEFILGLGSCFC